MDIFVHIHASLHCIIDTECHDARLCGQRAWRSLNIVFQHHIRSKSTNAIQLVRPPEGFDRALISTSTLTQSCPRYFYVEPESISCTQKPISRIIPRVLMFVHWLHINTFLKTDAQFSKQWTMNILSHHFRTSLYTLSFAYITHNSIITCPLQTEIFYVTQRHWSIVCTLMHSSYFSSSFTAPLSRLTNSTIARRQLGRLFRSETS